MFCRLSQCHVGFQWIKSLYLLCFLTKDKYSSTSSEDPTTKGTRWCSVSGSTSRTRWEPVVAVPPACSIRKAMGLHSYSSLSWRQENMWETHNLHNADTLVFKGCFHAFTSKFEADLFNFFFLSVVDLGGSTFFFLFRQNGFILYLLIYKLQILYLGHCFHAMVYICLL